VTVSEELRGLIVVAAAVVSALLGWLVFVVVPDTTAELLGVVLALVAVVAGIRVGGRIAAARFPSYDVASVTVSGPITRTGGPGPLPGRSVGTPADDVVDQVEAADEDDAVDALLVKLNTPGGEVVPSDDIRTAVAGFDGPTVAYTTDLCASGGYWIASGCDELWARDASLVGSIGVVASSVNVSELADDLGVAYERFVAGEYKDAGVALKDVSEDERAYLQGLVDGFYDDFVERVAEGRDLDPEAVRDTEARVFLGEAARELGLVDELGDRDDVEQRVADLLDRETVTVEEFEPRRGVAERLRGGAAATAYAFGAGVASQFAPDDEFEFRL
jgi:protease-4